MPPRLIVEVVGDTSRLEKSFQRASGASKGFGSSLGALSVGFGQLLKGVIVVDAIQKAFEGLGEAAHLGIEGFTDTTRVAAQTAAVIKSTGDASNLSAKQIHSLAASLSNVSGIDDEVIQSGENVLLSFTRIRDFAGKNNDVFTRATKVVTDYASRTGKSATTAATIIGRALADPATKAVALSRAGIVLTKSQLDALKAIEKTSGVVAAQKVLLGDLEERFQGASAAAGKTLPGQLNILRERFKDLAGELVGDVAPAFSGVIKGLTDTVVKVTEASGFHAKLNILWTGIEAAAKSAQSAIGNAIAKVNWDKVWAGANGIADGLQKRLQAVDWTGIGSSIGDGIAKAVSVAASAVKPIAEKIQKVIGAIDFVKVGKAAGPGLAAAMLVAFSTLFDPVFWIKNWDLALSIAAVRFGGSIGKVGARFAAPLTRLGVRLGEDLAVSLSRVFERLGTKLVDDGGPLLKAAGRLLQKFGSIVLDGLLKLPGLVERALSRLFGPVERSFGRLSRLTRFTIKVLGVEAVINTIEHAVSKIAGVFSGLAHTIGHALDSAWKELERGAIKAALAIVEPFTHIPTQIVGNKFQAIKHGLQTQLDEMVASSQTAGKAIQAGLAPATKALFVLGKPQGLLKAGNLDINHRPIVHNPGGSISTEESISVSVDKGQEVLIPTVFDGKHHSVEQAIAHFKKTQENLGTFASIKAANAYAEALHERQDVFYHAILDAQKNAKASPTFKAIQAAVSDPFAAVIALPSSSDTKAIGSRNASAAFAGIDLPPLPPPPPAKGLSATQKNTFFDNAISSDLTRAGFITNIKAQIGALQQIAGLISARIAATKDVTRRRTLEDQLLGVESQITGDRAQVASDFLSSLQFGVTKAQATATFKDDLAALGVLKAGIVAQIKATGDSLDLEQQLFEVNQQLKAVHVQVFQARIDLASFAVTKAQATPRFADDIKAFQALEAGIKAEIKATGDTLALEQQLFDARQQLKAAQISQRDAKQFQQLGLTATGDTRVPIVKTLRKQLANVSDAVQGTFLDTNKTQSVLKNITTVLSAGIGNVSATVRAKIEEMLTGITKSLSDHTGQLTKFAKANPTALLKAAGLDPDQIRKVRAILSQISGTGNIPGKGQGAFGFAVPGQAAPATGTSTTSSVASGNNHPVEVHTTINLDGKKVASNTTRHQQKTGRRNPVQKRGPNSGGI